MRRSLHKVHGRRQAAAARTEQDHGGQGNTMTERRYRLVIGNKNWSSWSLRPWLAMVRMGVPFEETNIRLRQPDSAAQLLQHSPSGRVPALFDGDLAIWDSLSHHRIPGRSAPGSAALAARATGARHRPLGQRRDALELPGPAPDLPDGAARPQPHGGGASRGRSRHPPHRRAVARVPRPLRGGRAVPVRGVLGGRCDVCASRLPVSHLHPRAFCPTATTARRRTTSRRSSPCRRWKLGPKERVPKRQRPSERNDRLNAG